MRPKEEGVPKLIEVAQGTRIRGAQASDVLVGAVE